jgi:hypothetical protein
MTLPNFLIIGAAKAGTSTQHTYLRAHPEIFMPARKELRFFAYDGEGDDLTFPVKSLAEYESYFAGVTGEKAIGEATPRYLRTPDTPRKIREVVPDCRLIVSLRDPSERSFSSYMMVVRNQNLTGVKSYGEALKKFPIFCRGYSEDLARYFQIFPREQIIVLRFEDLVRNPVGAAQTLFEFLQVDPTFEPEVERVANPGGLPKVRLLHGMLANKRVMNFGKRYVPERLLELAKGVRNKNLEKRRMTEDERREALAVFRDDILRTQDLIGQDLSAWLRVSA